MAGTPTSPDAPNDAAKAVFGPGPERFEAVAGIAAFVFPGLGHVVLGQPRRGLAIACGVLGLFFGGLLLGGIDAVDSREDRLWFIGQSLTGPLAFGVNWVHQNRFKAWAIEAPAQGGRREPVLRSAYEGEVRVSEPPPGGAMPYPSVAQRPQWGEADRYDGPRGATKSVGKINEIALLATTLAGMMNLVAILDALFNRRRPEREVREALRRATAGGASA
ncbi:MAG: DUF6677 family protein [Planctomycetota bacterium]